MIESVKHTKEIYAQIPMDRLWIYSDRKDIQIRIERDKIRVSISKDSSSKDVKTLSFEEFYIEIENIIKK